MEKGQAVEKDKQTESLYSAFCQRTSKMGENGKAERSEPIYKIKPTTLKFSLNKQYFFVVIIFLIGLGVGDA